MAEHKRNEKEEKRDEKEEKSRGEKDEKGRDEKWTRDPVAAVTWGCILILAGILLLLNNMNLLGYPWHDFWPVMFIGAGVILLLASLYRLTSAQHSRPIGGNVILGVVLLGVGLGWMFGWSYVWPIVIIIIALVILSRAFRRPPQ